MLVEGLKLMCIGMGTVLLFLLFVIALIQCVAGLVGKFATAECSASRNIMHGMGSAAGGFGDADADIAVIAAAVAVYEAECLG